VDSVLASKNGYVTSTRRLSGHTTALHVIKEVNRNEGYVLTLCGNKLVEYELFDTRDDADTQEFYSVYGKRIPNDRILDCVRCQNGLPRT
jgi:hypothetical protein